MVVKPQKFDTLTKEESDALIEKAQSGDIEATNKIVLRYLPLVKRVASSYELSEREDNEQNGILGIYRALATYKPEVAGFGTYAFYWIRHFIEQNSHYSDGQTLEGWDAPSDEDIENEYIRKDYVTKTVSYIERRKPPNYAKMLRMLGGGATLTEAGKELNLTKQRGSQIHLIILDLLKQRRKKYKWN